MKKVTLSLVVLVLLGFQVVFAQDESKSKVKVACDVVSGYLWRGMPGYSALGEQSIMAPSFQPTLAVGFGNFEVGAWGSFDFVGTYKEADVYVTFSTGGLTVGLYDYFWQADWLTRSYFDMDMETTGHVGEFMALYKSEKIPISVLGSVFIYGADKKYDYDLGTQDPKKNNYSSYLEVTYSFDKLDAFVGISPNDGYYGDGYGGVNSFGVVNLGVTGYKTVKVTESFEIPMKATFAVNPQHEKAYLTFGISF